MAAPELTGISVVGAGAFNPAIIHPWWLANKGLIPENAAEHAANQEAPHQMMVSAQVSVFVADWLQVQVTPEQAIFSTIEMARESDLRDFARGVFELLPETPVDAIGINVDSHFRVESEEAWHAFGDRFLPKDFWEPLFRGESWAKRPDGQHVGMRSMTVEVHRASTDLPGFIRVQVAPSVRLLPYGVFVGINAHFVVTAASEARGSASVAGRVLVDHWDETRALESQLVTELSESV